VVASTGRRSPWPGPADGAFYEGCFQHARGLGGPGAADPRWIWPPGPLSQNACPQPGASFAELGGGAKSSTKKRHPGPPMSCASATTDTLSRLGSRGDRRPMSWWLAHCDVTGLYFLGNPHDAQSPGNRVRCRIWPNWPPQPWAGSGGQWGSPAAMTTKADAGPNRHLQRNPGCGLADGRDPAVLDRPLRRRKAGHGVPAQHHTPWTESQEAGWPMPCLVKGSLRI